MREVTKAEFYDRIGTLDVVSNVIGSYPYTNEFYPRSSRYDVIGKIVGRIPEGKAMAKNTYYLA